MTLTEGCLVAIPIDVENFAIGQILVPGTVFYIGIDPKRRSPDMLDEPLNLRLFAWTTDGEIYRKIWRVIGAAPVPKAFPKPDYKFEKNGKMWVENFIRDTIRPYDPETDQQVAYRWSSSSPILSDAVMAANGLAPWEPHFDKLLA